MKKNFKRTLAKVMAVALTVTIAGTVAPDASAAKKIKLAKKSVTITKGKSKKVAIKNVKAKKVKKLTVKSSKKSVATVKKSGKTAIKVTGKKAGKAKITVKVKVGKKTTKLSLKVTVKNAKAPAATAAPAASAAADASATPAASAAADASAAPAASAAADASAAPVESAPAVEESKAPEATAPAEEKEKPTEPTVMQMAAENCPEWASNGQYATVVYNEDGTVDYSTDFVEPHEDSNGNMAEGSVYNNGVAFFIDPETKGKTDVSGYDYFALTIKTDAEICLLTWSGGADPASFWDKNDVWGQVQATVNNADGSKTLVYNTADIFSKANKAIAVGFALKATDYVGEYTGEEPYATKTAKVYGFTFTNTMPTAGGAEEPTETAAPETDDVENDGMVDLSKVLKSDNGTTWTAQEDGSYLMKATGTYQSVYLDATDIDFSKAKEIKITGISPKQIGFSVYAGDETFEGEFWNHVPTATYPFYGGSFTERDNGAGVEGKEGVETVVLSLNDTVRAKLTSGAIFAIGSHNKDGVPTDDDDNYLWDQIDIVICSIEVVFDDSIVAPQPTEAPEATEAPEVTEAPAETEAPTVDTADVETEDEEEEAPLVSLTSDAIQAQGGISNIVADESGLTFEASKANNGGGMVLGFTDAVDISDYSAVKVTLQTSAAAKLAIGLQDATATPNFWSFAAIGGVKYPQTSSAEAETITIDTSAMTGSVNGLLVKYNTYDDASAADSVTITVKSIEFVEAE